MTVEEAIKIWQKKKSAYLKREMEKFIDKKKKQKKEGEQWRKNTQEDDRKRK